MSDNQDIAGQAAGILGYIVACRVIFWQGSFYTQIYYEIIIICSEMQIPSTIEKHNICTLKAD